jgi:hypothetical protein
MEVSDLSLFGVLAFAGGLINGLWLYLACYTLVFKLFRLTSSRAFWLLLARYPLLTGVLGFCSTIEWSNSA